MDEQTDRVETADTAGGRNGGPMRHQQATTTVALPLATVEARLRDVESWPRFLQGVAAIRNTSHERYLFTFADGRDRRELTMVVKLRYHDHCFVWHGIAGPTVRGSLKLARVDDRHTTITLSLASLPIDLRAGMAEMLMPRTATAVLDLRLLERHLTSTAAAEPG